MAGHAIVLSHRVEFSKIPGKFTDNWNRLVAFPLRDGSELDLHTTKQDYENLADGQAGQITWGHDQLLHFDPDQPQQRR